MIEYKSKIEIDCIAKAGKILGKCHKYLSSNLKPGMHGKQIEKKIEKIIKDNGAIPSFKGYNGYPSSINVCINDEVVHGIPSYRKFKEGDIVTIDIGACYNKFHADCGWTYSIGAISEEKKELLKYTKEALMKAIEKVKPGVNIKSISSEIFNFIKKKKNLHIVKELSGHGIGRELHEDPLVLNYVDDSIDDFILKPGLVICIEPIVIIGSPEVEILNDNWTIVSKYGYDSAQFEHTVAVTENGCKILTLS